MWKIRNILRMQTREITIIIYNDTKKHSWNSIVSLNYLNQLNALYYINWTETMYTWIITFSLRSDFWKFQIENLSFILLSNILSEFHFRFVYIPTGLVYVKFSNFKFHMIYSMQNKSMPNHFRQLIIKPAS